MSSQVREVSLQEEAEKRYLSYAMSVITSRALPDVRDGLKPVQRRILYAMYQYLKLLPNAKFKKSAAIVGEVMGKLHPHGDQAIYDAMVRMAQPFSLLHPLVEGYGNFGSADGDRAAAFRYTEARLQPLSLTLLDELKQQTVDMRPNFDGTLEEPVTLPAQFPNILVNGSDGIAVGMATKIPPHNLGEVMDALLLVLDQPEATTAELLKRIKGPDFPTGGEIIASRKERIELYEKGQGNLILRGEWKEERIREKGKRGKRIIITSTPYMTTRATIVEKIAEIIHEKKLPPLQDVRDESTEQTRIVLELKSNADLDMVMAYLYKHTPLQQRYSANLTCLVPSPNPLVAAPERLSLKQILQQFLAFRLEVLERRFRYELERLLARIHILEGFAIVFNALDEAIQIIRESDGRKDSHAKLKARFGLSDKQTEAILDTRLYRLARLEIKEILDELAKLQARVAEIKTILESRDKMNAVLREEALAFKKAYAIPRKTRIREGDKIPELQEDTFIQEEDTHVVLTRDGWVKRVRTINKISSIRVREGDEILAILPGSTKETVCFLTNLGIAYTTRIWDVEATSGYGVPLQGMFKFKDGERVVAGISLDPRVCGDIGLLSGTECKHKSSVATSTKQDATEVANNAKNPAKEELPPNHLLVITQHGFGSRLALNAFYEPSNKSGRRFCRLAKGDQVLTAQLVDGQETLVLVSESQRYLIFPVTEVKALSGPGKGVGLMRLDEGDRLFAGRALKSPSDSLVLETEDGQQMALCPANLKMGKRLTRGTRKRGAKPWKRIVSEPLIVPSMRENEVEDAEKNDAEQPEVEPLFDDGTMDLPLTFESPGSEQK